MDRPHDDTEQDKLRELLAASRRADRDAFAELYTLTSSRLFAVALRLMRRRDSAEDVLQEAFVLIWRKADSYRPERGGPLQWMATIVRNCAIDRLRAQAREPRDFADWEDGVEALVDPASGDQALPFHLAQTLRTCLEHLQDSQRTAILLAYYYGLTHDELAAKMNSPLGTIKSWVRRGLLQLKDCLEA